jgi:hypothetical protein
VLLLNGYAALGPSTTAFLSPIIRWIILQLMNYKLRLSNSVFTPSDRPLNALYDRLLVQPPYAALHDLVKILKRLEKAT